MKYYRTSYAAIQLDAETFLVHCCEDRTGISRVYTLRGTDVYVSSYDVWQAAERQIVNYTAFKALPSQGRAALRGVFQDELDRYSNPQLL